MLRRFQKYSNTRGNRSSRRLFQKTLPEDSSRRLARISEARRKYPSCFDSVFCNLRAVRSPRKVRLSKIELYREDAAFSACSISRGIHRGGARQRVLRTMHARTHARTHISADNSARPRAVKRARDSGERVICAESLITLDFTRNGSPRDRP